jgi:REP element-mobilizing transposase RayT
MRITRKMLLANSRGIIHKFWRCHNKAFLLITDAAKTLYLNSLKSGLKDRKVNGEVKLEAYCVMNNHAHQILSYSGGSESVSRFMRIAHSEFGRLFNRLFKRTGTVLNERPKTVVVQESDESLMRAHMYVEANPIRAKMNTPENLKQYRFSSFRYYAYGIIDEFTKLLTPPEWYLRLGSTPEERQRKYRSLFYAYLNANRYFSRDYLKKFIGDTLWCFEQTKLLSARVLLSKAAPS